MSFIWPEVIKKLEMKEINNLFEHQKVSNFIRLRKEIPLNFSGLVDSGRLPQAKTGLFRRSPNWKDLINMPDDNGVTLLMYAAVLDCHFLIKFLVKNGADVNYQGLGKATALHAACEYGAGNAVEELLSNANPDITLRDEDGKTAEDIVKQLKSTTTFLQKSNVIRIHEDKQGFFIDSGASIDQINSKEYITRLFLSYKMSLKQAEMILERDTPKKKAAG